MIYIISFIRIQFQHDKFRMHMYKNTTVLYNLPTTKSKD